MIARVIFDIPNPKTLDSIVESAAQSFKVKSAVPLMCRSERPARDVSSGRV